ncbi:DUF2345 domain-containing protein [Pseudomonas syringae]|uniref:DUF2345 domain-containing protein n=1 Tax=Pseudomonas syringae TaxID=317 RepID=A0A085V917_PSESX|nr:DUF2345 domain-containing protein [Pseudomonas syringae]KFE51930.1 hypothetical protein IV01_22665 [Pseudomonas syringae]
MSMLKLTLGVFFVLALSGCEQAASFWHSITSIEQTLTSDLPLQTRGPVTIRAGSGVLVSADDAVSVNSVNGEITLDAPHGISLVSGGAHIRIKDGSIDISAPGELRIDNSKISYGAGMAQKKLPEPEVLATSAPIDFFQEPVVSPPPVAPVVDTTPETREVAPVGAKPASTSVVDEPVGADLKKGGFQIKDSTTNQPKANVAYRIEVADGRVIRGVTDENGFTQQVYSREPQKIQLFFE